MPLTLTHFRPHEYRPDGPVSFRIKNRLRKVIDGRVFTSEYESYIDAEVSDYFLEGLGCLPLSGFAVWDKGEASAFDFTDALSNYTFVWRKLSVSYFESFGLKSFTLWDFESTFGFRSVLSLLLRKYSENPEVNKLLNLYDLGVIDRSVIKDIFSGSGLTEHSVYDQLKYNRIRIPALAYGYNNHLYFSVSPFTFLSFDATKASPFTLDLLEEQWSCIMPRIFFKRPLTDTEKLAASLKLFNLKIQQHESTRKQ